MKIMSNKKLNKLAVNTSPIKDKLVYRGFIDDDRYSDDDVEYDFDETLVMICPRGDWKGGTTNGKIVNQKIDDTALEMLVNNATEEVLVDKDHASMKDVFNRDTQAYGRASDFVAVKDAGDFSGLYGKIKWSEEGKDLIKDRSYRFLSPAFELDEDGRPIKLISIGLTNRPNFKMTPILNSESGDVDKETSIIEDVTTKEEIIELIRSIINEKTNTDEGKTDDADDAKVDDKDDTKVDTDEVGSTEVGSTDVGDKKEVCENADEDGKKKVCQNESPKTESPKTEEKEDEVIKEETLNSVVDEHPSVEGNEEWRNLHGEELRKWMAENL